MAVDFTIKQGDTAPAITAILKDANGDPVNITSTSLVFLMTNKSTDELVVQATAQLVDAPNGKVRYQWLPGDTDIPATYKAEFEVHWPDDTFETFPNSKYINVKIVADLGGTVG